MLPYQNLMNQGGDWPPQNAPTSAPISAPSTCNAVAAMATAATVPSSLPFLADSPLGLQLPTTTAASQTAWLQQILSNRYRCLQCPFSAADLLTAHQHNLTAHNVINGSVFDSLNPTAQTDLSLLLSSAATLPGASIASPPLPTPVPTVAAIPTVPAIPAVPSLSTVGTVLAPTPADPSILQQQIQQHYESLAPEGQVRCETCGKYLCKKKPLSSLINHAKRHYASKQFNCTECSYGSSEAAHVRNHMRLRHSVVDKEPADLRDPCLQQAWMSIASRCFPSMTEHLARFRFKRFRKRRRSSPTASTSRGSFELPSSSTSTSVTLETAGSLIRSRSLSESPESLSAFHIPVSKTSHSI